MLLTNGREGKLTVLKHGVLRVRLRRWGLKVAFHDECLGFYGHKLGIDDGKLMVFRKEMIK